ncbi:MAG TPA: hypothetical protein VK172_14745 [Lentimicrobium sp.]|nr:hypothetical protein [Bacteroidales bacterium]HLO92420.1 hypothetical protein [Lentimicrobium sp.]
MKKIGFLLTALLVAAIAFTACSKTDDLQGKQKASTALYADQGNAEQADLMVNATYEENVAAAGAVFVQDTEPVKDTGSKLDFSTILNIVLSVLTVILGGFMAKFKLKLGQLVSVGTAVISAGVEIDKALADNNVSKEEIAIIRAKAKDVRDKFKELISFKKKE